MQLPDPIQNESDIDYLERVRILVAQAVQIVNQANAVLGTPAHDQNVNNLQEIRLIWGSMAAKIEGKKSLDNHGSGSSCDA